MNDHSLIENTLELFLNSLGHRQEYEFYLKKFKSDFSHSFALLCPDAESLRTAPDAILMAMRYLRRLDLIPTLVLCQPDAEQHFSALQGLAGDPLVAIHWPQARAHVQSRLHRIRLSGGLPVLLASQMLRPCLLDLAECIAGRVHLIRMRGGVRNRSETEELYVRLPADLKSYAQDDQALLTLSVDLLEDNERLHISVVSPYNLIKEIFTVKGAGTIVRPALTIKQTDLAGLDQIRLQQVLQNSFGRTLSSHFDINRVNSVFFEAEYRGAILLEKHDIGMYLSKFAVGSQARGLGVGQDLWEQVIASTPALFWRSRKGNSINRWYRNVADGCHNLAEWCVFWRGIALDAIPEAIEYCATRPPDFD